MIDVSVLEKDGDAWVLNTGSPHYVSTVQNLSQLDVYSCGKAIRYNNTYAEKGINVNFIEEENTGYTVRTYERGVEDETLACGTGVTAVALAMAKEKGLIGTHNTPISVRGGSLNVRFTFDGKKFTDVFLEGPATLVYEGTIQG
jgi:diaminopimelate epimerase